MMFVGPSDDERWAKPTTANGGPLAGHSVVSLGCCCGGQWPRDVCISRWRFMVAMVLFVKMEREEVRVRERSLHYLCESLVTK
jgi:hypothetical protein